MTEEQQKAFDTLNNLMYEVGEIVKAQGWSAAFMMETKGKRVFVCNGSTSTLVGMMLRYAAKISASSDDEAEEVNDGTQD